MKRIFLLISIVLSCASLSAQEVTAIAATILDSETNKPIEFVNIGFVEKGIGTVSNELGNFSLAWKSADVKNTSYLEFSSLGYETKKIPFSGLSDFTSYESVVYLSPTAYDLAEIVIKKEKRAFEKLGSSTYAKDRVGYWMNMNGLGGEIATKIDINKKNTLLQKLTFNIQENKADSLLIRVKVYDYHRGKPGKNLVTQNIFHVISKKKGEETIPLKKYNIIASEDVIVSLELVAVYGNEIYFEVASSPYGGVSYTKDKSMGGWIAYRGVGLGFSLLSSYPVNGGETTIVNRKKPTTIDLYWDTSLPMNQRNESEELKLLSKYITHLQDVTVRTITFSKGNTEEKIFQIKNGRSKDLKNYLKSVYYNGASDFSQVLKSNPGNAEVVLVFTNGSSLFTPLQTAISIPVFCVNSKSKANHSLLQNISYVSGGYYVNLARSNYKDALSFMINDIEDPYNYKQQKEDKSGYVHGVVYNENGVPLQGATVKIKNTFNEVQTASNGSYAINAVLDDVLTINAFGMYQKDTVVGALKKLHIPLKTNRELLDEVFLEAKTTSDEIATTMVETPFGRTKRGAVGFSTYQTITSDQIGDHVIELSQLVNMGRGVEVIPQDIVGTFKYRFRKFRRASFVLETYAAVVIDDIVYDQNLPNVTVPLINPQTIERITLLSTAASAIRYGSAAAFGAIVIETKNYKQGKDIMTTATEDTKPIALAQNNEYTDATSVAFYEKKKVPESYIMELQQSESFDIAKAAYVRLQKEYGHTIPFYIETANYFESIQPAFAENIRSSIVALAPENRKALKALAFQYEALGKIQEAKQLYEHLLNLDPKAVQPYLNVARTSVETGDIKTAETLYTQLIFNSIPNVSVAEVEDQIISEVSHLAANHKSKINYERLPQELLALGYKEDIRLVFEWNHTDTDFELQFVNPEDKFFTFSHTQFENRELLEAEIKDGVQSKAFTIDDEIPGRWLINVSHLGTIQTDNPTYLKYTIYTNYGLLNETKEIKVINLSKYTEKMTLDTFSL